jgi:heme exporter protein C
LGNPAGAILRLFMRLALRWFLWLVLALVILAAFGESTKPAQGFLGETGRILYFHVPNAWASFVAFLAAGIWSLKFLFAGRRPSDDRAAQAAVEIGLLFAVLATLSGAIWARVQWGAFWNWDPRQTSITLALLFYGAYLALRGAIEDRDTRARLGAAYAVLGLVVAPFLYFVLPRLAEFTLHPEPVVNPSGKIEMERPMLLVLLGGAACFTVLFFWLHKLRCRLAALDETTVSD